MTASSSSIKTKTPAYGHELAEQILARHQAVDVGPGARLMTERQLATDLGVTRTMIRHALAILEAEGRISREVGRGTFLRDPHRRRGAPTVRPADSGDQEVGPADVMVARKLLEPQVIPVVIAWATTRDFEEMRRCLEGGGAAESYDEFEVWDFALHHAIVAASRNRLLLDMYAVIEGARHGAIWGSLKRRSDSADRRASYHQDHVELIEALTARDLTLAVAAMEAHLDRVEANLLGSGPKSSHG
jgi:GntR family uxuAB operon transcriptional repressor